MILNRSTRREKRYGHKSSPAPDIVKERFTKLFEFLKAFSDLQYPLVSNIDEQLRVLWLGNFSGHAGVEVYRDEPKETEIIADNTIVFRVARPNLTLCPPPPAILKEWIKPGWQNIEGKVETQSSRKRLEALEDDSQRVTALKRWTQEREQWIKSEKPPRKASSAVRGSL